ncbi:hypothetical protein [Streptomyces sp. NPDC055140]
MFRTGRLVVIRSSGCSVGGRYGYSTADHRYHRLDDCGARAKSSARAGPLAGTFPNDRTEYVVPVAPVTARHVALRALSEHGDQNRFAAVAELDVVRAR